MKIYISGKISGLFDYKQKFDEAEQILKDMGHIVFNPTIFPLGLEYDEYMRLSYAMIDCADAVYLLDNWQDSKGARHEREYAMQRGKRIITEKEDKYKRLRMLSDDDFRMKA